MKLIIFAGGAGTRLWPLSRQNSPKQFSKLLDSESTLQMAFSRVKKFGVENIYISTNQKYVDLVKEQLPDLPDKNIFSEPAKRDLAAAVGLTLLRLKNSGVCGPTVILWADHFMEKPETFVDVLENGCKMVEKNPGKMIFLGEKPRFANQNLGWIRVGKNLSNDSFEFLGWKYRPDTLECQEMFETGDWLWNPGYFIFDLDFVLSLYRKLMPEMYLALEEMVEDNNKINIEYPKLETISFDQAIVEKLSQNQAVVLKTDFGWSDPGTLYALKEALSGSGDENYLKGNVIEYNVKDSFIYNEEKNKLVAVVGADGFVVVNTPDAMLVCPKNKVPEIKELLKKLEKEGMGRYL